MRDAAAFFDHLKLVGFTPATIIDVGVANGTADIYDAFPDAHYLLIEAVAEFEPRLQEIMSELSGEYILTAVSDKPGEAEMMVTEPLYVSSLQYDQSLRKEALRTVPVDTLENIVGARQLAGPIMLKTDCQGHDLKVIQGAGKALEQIELVISELPLYGPWGGGSELIDYVNGMDELGYRVYDIWGWLYRTGDQRLQHLDLVFAKTDGLLRQNKLFPQGPQNVGYFVRNYEPAVAAAQDQSVQPSEAEAIWGLEDYAVWVPLTDTFYENLKFNAITQEQFESGSYPKQPSYRDSRTYLQPIIEALSESGAAPQVFDVGAYVGRFSIEAAIACQTTGVDCEIVCFEPGATGNLVARNLSLNKVEQRVVLERCAVSDENRVIDFGIPDRANITSRIVKSASTMAPFGDDWTMKQVRSVRLAKYLSAQPRPFICKIDTEGHEAEVIRGIGRKNLKTRPHVLIIEFWPSVLKSDLFGQPFADYILRNYVVLNIGNSLYPRGYRRIDDFASVLELLQEDGVNNLDLMLISRTIKHRPELIKRVRS